MRGFCNLFLIQFKLFTTLIFCILISHKVMRGFAIYFNFKNYFISYYAQGHGGVLQFDQYEVLAILHPKLRFSFAIFPKRNDEMDGGAEVARVELAPCALDAYPEAYSEFKQCMLLLLNCAEPVRYPTPVIGQLVS